MKTQSKVPLLTFDETNSLKLTGAGREGCEPVAGWLKNYFHNLPPRKLKQVKQMRVNRRHLQILKFSNF
jgi:hypothetical protein